MSRAYRIKVKESVKRDVKAEDSIRTEIELIEILPAEQMGELLARELEGRGFRRATTARFTRTEGNGVTIAVEPCTGEVTIRAETEQTVEVEGNPRGLRLRRTSAPTANRSRGRLSKN